MRVNYCFKVKYKNLIKKTSFAIGLVKPQRFNAFIMSQHITVVVSRQIVQVYKASQTVCIKRMPLSKNMFIISAPCSENYKALFHYKLTMDQK